jgi:hypothetical protein
MKRDRRFLYRSSSRLTEFFRECDTEYEQDGSTRRDWVAWARARVLEEPHLDLNTPPDSFLRIIQALMDQGDAVGENSAREDALGQLNAAMAREGYETFYA